MPHLTYEIGMTEWPNLLQYHSVESLNPCSVLRMVLGLRCPGAMIARRNWTLFFSPRALLLLLSPDSGSWCGCGFPIPALIGIPIGWRLTFMPFNLSASLETLLDDLLFILWGICVFVFVSSVLEFVFDMFIPGNRDATGIVSLLLSILGDGEELGV